MRIAIFQDTFLPKIDGVQVSTEKFRHELAKRGHDVLVIAPRHPSLKSDHIGYKLIEAFPTDFLYPGLSMGKTWKTDLGKIFGEFQPDIIHSMSEFTIGLHLANAFRKRFLVPRVHTFHTYFSQYIYFVPKFLRNLLKPIVPKVTRAIASRGIDSIVVPTLAMQKYFIDECAIRSPVNVVPNGIDISKFSQMNGAAFRAKHKISKEERVVLTLGRIAQDKLVDVIIRSFAKLREGGLRDIRLVVAGVGPKSYMNYLKRVAKEEGIFDVVWAGYVGGQDWLDCYGAADLSLIPSITETFCLVLLESFAAGVPVVASNAMGPASLMKGEKGGLFSLPEPNDCARQAHRLLLDRELWMKKQVEGLEIAKNFAIESSTDKLESLYEKTLASNIFVN